MYKSKGIWSPPESEGVQIRAGGSRGSVAETLCAESGALDGSSEDRQTVPGANPSGGGTEENRGAAADKGCETGFSVLRDDERDRHVVFSRAVASALLGSRRRTGGVRSPDLAERPKCSHVLTVQELKFLLE